MGMHAYACTVNTLERFTDFHGGSTIGAYIAFMAVPRSLHQVPRNQLTLP